MMTLSWRVRRKWPILMTVVLLTTGMAYCLLWGPVVQHRDRWISSGDIWGAYRSAHFIAWGSLGSVYAASTRIITFPGILLLFAPVTLLTGRLGMTESFPFTVPHPSAWLVLGPIEILIGCAALFACDALAERMGVGRGRRLALCVAEGLVLWPVLVIWGHPEDALALALALYALLLALDDRWGGAGWLFGTAIATQPLVLLMGPVLLAMAGKGRAPALLLRSALPGVFLLATPLAAEFHATAHALLTQPNFPRIDHATPWTSLAPKLGGSGKSTAVAAGPGRVVALLAAGALGWWARRWRDRPDLLVWAAATALALRCVSESVLVSYYLWPTLAVGLIVVARRSGGRLVLGLSAAAFVTLGSQFHLGEWVWWGLVNGGLLVILLSGFPPRASRLCEEVPINHNTAGTEPIQEHPRALVGATR